MALLRMKVLYSKTLNVTQQAPIFGSIVVIIYSKIKKSLQGPFH